MTMDGNHTAPGDASDVRKLSREEFETLCLLYLIDEGADSANAVTARLDLSADHEGIVDRALSRLTSIGCLELRGDRVSITTGGRDWLERWKS